MTVIASTSLRSSLTASEMAEVTAFVAEASSGNYLQMPTWIADCPPPGRHRYVHLIARDGAGRIAGYGLTRITRMLPYFRLATIRRGPVVASLDQLGPVCTAFAHALRARGVCTLMLNPRWQGEEEVAAAGRALAALGAVRAHPDNQPLHQATLLVDLGGDANALNARIRQRARRQIKKGEKLGLTVRQANSLEDARQFAPLMKQFYDKRKLGMENIPPVDALYEMSRERGAFLLGEIEGEIVCGHVAIPDGDKLFWLVMAGDDAKKNIPKNYPLVAEACRLGQAQGFRWYDMAGAPVAGEDEETHAAAARRNEFKAAFSPIYQPLVPMYQLPLRQPAHRLVFGLRQWLRASRNRRRLARA